MKYTLLVLALIFITLSGCKKDKKKDTPAPDYTERDEKIIQDYFIENNITDAIADASGVYIKHLEEGEGELASGDIDIIKVVYTGYYLPSKKVLDNAQTPIELKLSTLYQGWQIGIPYMRKGGKATLYIPSKYTTLSSPIMFNITLIDFTRKKNP